MRKLIVFLFIITATISSVSAQDTLRELSLENFLLVVKNNHPLARIVQNDVQAANTMVNLSKGAFDPVLLGNLDQKYYNGTNYFTTISTGIKLPTRLGIDVKVLTDWNSGTYLNPQSEVPNDGLSYLGVEVPLGRGLFIDERRAQLRKAVVGQNLAQAERLLQLNELCYQAGSAFIFWQEQVELFTISKTAFTFAADRFSQTKIYAENGDRPYIDTVEAYGQLLVREMELQQRELAVSNARLAVEMYIWSENFLPLQLDTSVSCEKLKIQPIAIVTDNLLHPKLDAYSFKLNQLAIDRRWKVEQLKPQVTANYNLLQRNNDVFSTNYSFQNYKWGLNVYMPILLRKERNSLQITNFKIANTQLELVETTRELSIKQQQMRNEWGAYIQQNSIAQNASSQYFQLVEAERILFQTGESSIFLINAREISYLTSESKRIETLSKVNKARLGFLYYSGELGR